ncbi:hypothetical protein L0337_02920 [candidate division KSB1 bacterium]|nr:hypothetical protein [candidate division KSB1 bacterium]
MKILDKLQLGLWPTRETMPALRRLLRFVLPFLLISGCGERHVMKEVRLEFKQQPQETYVYSVSDSVEWEIEEADKPRYTFQHLQAQESRMLIEAIDSAAVRVLTMSFVVTEDTMIDAPEFVLKRRRKAMIGWKFGFDLRMRKNGEIVKVVTDDPKLAFEYDRAYKPSQPVFPDHAIKPGYAWTQNFSVEVPRGNPTVATTRYQLDSFTQVDRFDCAVINFKGELEYQECYQPPADKPSKEFIAKKYRSQVTSEGRIYFAHREGFMVKKVNLITWKLLTTTFTKDKVEQQSRTTVKDYERITLTEIHRPDQEVFSYSIP